MKPKQPEKYAVSFFSVEAKNKKKTKNHKINWIVGEEKIERNGFVYFLCNQKSNKNKFSSL